MRKKSMFIFDFFGVICTEVAPYWFNQYFSEEDAVREKAAIVGKADRGEITETQLFIELGKAVGERPEKVLDDWLSLAKVDVTMLPLLQKLRKYSYVTLLSNAPSEFLNRILTRDLLTNYFDHILISSDVGIAKPNPAIYRKMLELAGTQAAHTLMIDDNPDNLDGAATIGIKGILFKSPESLKNQLANWNKGFENS